MALLRLSVHNHFRLANKVLFLIFMDSSIHRFIAFTF